MRLLIHRFLLLATCLLLASGFQASAHHGGEHPAWEVDEFADEAFKIAPGFWVGAAAAILLGAGSVITLKRQPAHQAETSRRHQG